MPLATGLWLERKVLKIHQVQRYAVVQADQNTHIIRLTGHDFPSMLHGDVYYMHLYTDENELRLYCIAFLLLKWKLTLLLQYACPVFGQRITVYGCLQNPRFARFVESVL